jgi:hypothetical protein
MDHILGFEIKGGKNLGLVGVISLTLQFFSEIILSFLSEVFSEYEKC